MRICWQGFASSNHSWSFCAQNICRSLIKKGHQVDLFSTNGISFFPDDLKNNLIGFYNEKNGQVVGKMPDLEYDCQISYTAFKNFEKYLSHGNKNRFGIWTYEFAGKNALPDGFAKCYKYSDKILAPSTFAKQVFVDSGVPSDHIVVIPHGIDFEQVNSAAPYLFKTKKFVKILSVIAQVHKRKNLAGMLDMYGKAFTSKDDVCLVLKVQDREPSQSFEQSFKKIFSLFKAKYNNHAEVEIIREFVPNIYSLYKSCDIVFSASYCEGFGMTALDSHALGKINIAPNYGGFTDFLDSENSLLIEGKAFNVPADFLYWSHKNGTKAFMPDIDSGVNQLRYAYNNTTNLLDKFKSNIDMAKNKYNWDTVADQIMELTDV